MTTTRVEKIVAYLHKYEGQEVSTSEIAAHVKQPVNYVSSSIAGALKKDPAIIKVRRGVFVYAKGGTPMADDRPVPAPRSNGVPKSFSVIMHGKKGTLLKANDGSVYLLGEKVL